MKTMGIRARRVACAFAAIAISGCAASYSAFKTSLDQNTRIEIRAASSGVSYGGDLEIGNAAREAALATAKSVAAVFAAKYPGSPIETSDKVSLILMPSMVESYLKSKDATPTLVVLVASGGEYDCSGQECTLELASYAIMRDTRSASKTSSKLAQVMSAATPVADPTVGTLQSEIPIDALAPALAEASAKGAEQLTREISSSD